MGLTNQAPDLLPGTLDMLILQTLVTGPKHGYGIAERLKQVSRDVLQVGESSLYPALQRLLLNGWVSARVGSVGKQPAGALLHHHRGGQKAARIRARRIRAPGLRHPARAADELTRCHGCCGVFNGGCEVDKRTPTLRPSSSSIAR